MIHVGFTGSRDGMSARQRARLILLLTFSRSGPGVLHHGDCVGADAEAHAVALDCGWSVVVHPPIESPLRAHCAGPDDRVSVLAPLPYLERDRAIVDACSFLLAAPRSNERRGGTWYTIGYAKRTGRSLEVLAR